MGPRCQFAKYENLKHNKSWLLPLLPIGTAT
ncbi:MAG: hypothetical protein ACI92Z_001019, partial [Paracoccaceae bacterium]